MAARSGAFERYLRTGRRSLPLELKFNPNHDPANGQFTSGDGGHAHASRKPPAHARQDGPFREAARRQDTVGHAARAVNAFVQGQSASLTLPLGGAAGSVTVTRTSGSAVTLDQRFFMATGRLNVVPGREEITLDLAAPTLKVPLMRLTSFPSRVRIFQAISGNINYSFDRSIQYAAPLMKPVTLMSKGTYVFARGGK